MSDLTPKPIKHTPYLTVIAGRRPRQKAHTARAHADAALRVHCWRRFGDYDAEKRRSVTWLELSCDMALYEWRDEAWQLLWNGNKGDVIDREHPAWKDAK